MPHEQLLLATAELKVRTERGRDREQGVIPCRGVEFIRCCVWLCAVAVIALGAGAYSSGLCTLGPDGLEWTFLPPSKGTVEPVAALKQELSLLQGFCVLPAQRQMSCTCIQGTWCAARS